MVKIYLLSTFLIIYHNSNSQISPNKLLNDVYRKMLAVKDYTVEAKIKSDIPLIKILPVKAKIFFKQENKFKVESKSIAILPKQGLSEFSTIIKDSNSYTAIITGSEKINFVNSSIVNVIPLSNDELILAKLWVDPKKNIVMQSQLTTRSSGTMLINYFYKTQEQFGLPDSLVFTVDVKKFKIPKGVTADVNKTRKKDTKEDLNKKGKIFIKLSNYEINRGLSDNIFKKQDN